MSIKKDIFAPLALGLGATRRAAMLLLLVMMLTATTAWATTTSTITVGGTDYTLFTGFTATGGNGYNWANLVDGNTSTDWIAEKSCNNGDPNAPAGDFNGGTDDPAFVEFHADAPFIPKGYVLTCYHENAGFWKPVEWALKAKLNEGDAWTTIHSSNTTLGAGKTFEIPCSNDGNNKYQYFRFEVYEVGLTDIVDLDELQFYGSLPAYTHLTVKAATCTATGIKRDCYRRNSDGKYFTDETGATELAESDVIAPMIPHTGERHEATDVNIEYWQCSMCGTYFSDEGCTTEITEEQTKIYRTITIDVSISSLVTSDVSQALAGTTMYLYVSDLIDASTLKVNNGAVELTAETDIQYTFTMPAADVTVTAEVAQSNADGDILTGSIRHTVTIPDRASITLSNAAISGSIVCEGSATITLVGTNSVSGATNTAGIQIGGSGTTLTIKGDGSLTANGGAQSAGIGLCRAWDPANDVIGGDIVIEGGNITANGGSQWGAGIGTGVIYGNGSAKTARIGNITIKGGTVKATGGTSADGIGTGYTYFGCTNAIGTVTIYDGIDKVDASSIKNSGSIVYKHDETDVTDSKADYFTIIENGNRRIIVQKVTPTIADVPDQTYTGSEIKPEPLVMAGSLNLTKGTDYVYSYENNENVGTAKVIATFQGDYASLGSVEKEFTITLDPADISVNAAGTEYTIHTAGGWNAFCDLLAANTKGYFSGKTVKLDADIAVSRMAGGHEFTGTFDGDDHTLTLAYGTADAPVDAQFIAPFVETAADDSNQPVFRNLTIDGTIYASNPQAADHYHVGGLIGHLFGDVTIEHCNSLVHITAPGGAGGFVGLCEHTAMFTDCLSSAVITSPGGNNSGFVGWSRVSGHAISFDGCTFNGKLLQQDGNGSHNGGFIGWTGANKTVTFTNCLCAPATLASGETMASGNSATFARGWNATTTATNSYYTQTFGDAQGTKPIVTASKPSNIGDVGTAYNVSGITAYGNGLLYGSDYYCGDSQFGEIALAYSGSSLTATIDGTSVATVSIPEDVTVNSVTYNRTFTEGKPSTVMLPFSKDVNEISGGTFYTFGGVEKKNNKWEATMNEVMGSLTANTPYLFVPTGTSLTFTGGATLNTTGGGNCLASDTGWEFHGTYTNKVWDEVETHDYGFAALSGTSADDKSVEAGQFVRLTTGASAKPMRCYLSYVGVPNQARALTRGAAATDEELPQSIIVRLVGSNGETTAIGTIDTKTGEMTFFDEQSGKAERDSEAWYTLDGVRLSGKPTKKGLYINNGKKVVIK